MRPTKTQISLRIRAVWSESSLSEWRNFAPLAIQKISPVKILIRPRECAGWSESSLGAHFWGYVAAQIWICLLKQNLLEDRQEWRGEAVKIEVIPFAYQYGASRNHPESKGTQRGLSPSFSHLLRFSQTIMWHTVLILKVALGAMHFLNLGLLLDCKYS